VSHVVFGTGSVGLALIDQLAAAGEEVIAVNRSGNAEVPSRVRVVAGDAANAAFAADVTKGAAVVYQCLNPPYTQWPELFPPMQAAVLAAATAADAKLVSFENLYMYGPTDGEPLSEELPYAADTRKGSVRGKMADDLLAAHEAGTVRIAIGRASDYFGPRGRVSAMGERVFYPVLADKKAQVMGNPDLPHTYSYVPDIAAGLATLGVRDEAEGRAWHLPNPQTLTTREFVARIGDAVGTRGAVSAMPKAMLNVVGLFNGNVRELKEMLYEFEEPFIVDSSDFEATFDQHATDLDEAIAATVAWYRENPK